MDFHGFFMHFVKIRPSFRPQIFPIAPLLSHTHRENLSCLFKHKLIGIMCVLAYSHSKVTPACHQESTHLNASCICLRKWPYLRLKSWAV